MIQIEFVDSEVYHVYIRKWRDGYYLATNICRGPAKKGSNYGPAVEFQIDKKTGIVTVIKQHNEELTC